MFTKMNNNKKYKKKIVFIGGHLTPAMVVLKETQKRGYRNIYWIGTKKNQAGNKNLSVEYLIVNKENIKFFSLDTGKLIRKWSITNFIYGLKQIIKIPLGLINSLLIIIRIRPNLIVSFGGYLSVFPVFWGKVLGSKIIVHEQTLVPGLANKFAALFANKILTSWENVNFRFGNKKLINTGNPIRTSIFTVKTESLTKSFNPNKKNILVFCGNQGSHFVNKCIFEILEELLEEFNVIHQTGSSSVTMDFQKAIDIKNTLPSHLSLSYTVRNYIEEEIGEALNKSDLVICRAGANTVTEILALGKPSILIPIPWTSGQEQLKNAQMVEGVGLGILLEQHSLTPELLLHKIHFAMENIKNNRALNTKPLEEAKNKAKEIINLSAHTKIVDIMENILNLNYEPR